jgi:hypothetical protein
MSRVSLRPPRQVMNVQKEQLPKPHPRPFESVRAKIRESLAAALGLDSDHLSGQQSASNVSYFGSAVEKVIRAGDIVLGAPECASELNSRKDLTSDIDAGVIVSLNEPESKRLKISDEVTGETKGAIQNVQILPFRIEQELFKLFGAVNKKYKEKGRSLLFNLKDKSNPALRERVLSGDITPKFLCSMTTEELASKELSAWRLAKAEELAKMVVLPDREVDIRTLVRKKLIKGNSMLRSKNLMESRLRLSLVAICFPIYQNLLKAKPNLKIGQIYIEETRNQIPVWKMKLVAKATVTCRAI